MDPFVYAYEALGAALSQQKLFYSGFEPGPSPDQTSDLNFVTKVYKQIFGTRRRATTNSGLRQPVELP